MQPASGLTPTMPPFPLILKATTMPFTSLDSAEVSSIRSPTHPCQPSGISVGGTSPPLIRTTTEHQVTTAPNNTVRDGGSTIVPTFV